jgi:hypothetical protein
MKKLGVILCIIFVATCFSSAESVFSANVLGYKRITVPANEYVLVSLNFENADNTVSNLFVSLPTGSEILFWDPTAQGYATVSKLRTGWSPSGTNKLEIGSGAFVKVAANTNIVLAGEVPLAPTSTIYTVNGYALVSYPYPVVQAFTNTTLSQGALTGDSISLWNNGWTSYTKLRTGWSPSSITNVQLQLGKALLYKAAAARTVDETKPYTID